ncbi:MAG: amino acid adenylation domain-containing protein, partial [Acidobacteria bacterium]|nr:amino acid adenylation domain-containing protein [Acidobacteriota bacterium]
LRHVFASGEALTVKQVENFNRLLKSSGTRLINLYGPTEATVDVSYFNCTDETRENIPIGKPIDNIQLYIVDKVKHLQPVGIPGELCISGVGLARGYLNNPELTAEKFRPQITLMPQIDRIKKTKINKSFAGVKGELFQKPPLVTYKTGDWARWLEDGNIEFLGRIDQQVKIRGFRIELGEIEARLLKAPQVKAAIVTTKSNPAGDLYLCAYIVPHIAAVGDLDINSIREFLARQLPAYMIPTYFVPMAEIPLTANGKIDRKRLPLPGIKSTGIYKPPSSETEKQLAAIWRDVLDLEQVGIAENFFSAGGDSIKTIRLVSRINERLSSHLKIVDLYTHGTIEKLAALISREESEWRLVLTKKVQAGIAGLKERIFAGYAGLNSGAIEDIYPMSDIEKGMVFYYMKHAGTGIYHDQFVYQLHYKDFDPGLFKRALALQVQEHAILRTAFNIDEYEEPIHIIYKEVELNFFYTDISGLNIDQQREHIASYIINDRRNMFDTLKPPLWRLQFFNLGNHRLYLLFIFHHAILDGWSVSSLMTGLHHTYLQLKNDAAYVPPALHAGYKDSVIEELVEKADERTRRYWQEELRGYTRLNFSETVKGKSELEPMKVYRYHAEGALLEKARQIAADWHTNIKNLCFSAYAFLMKMFSPENDMILGCVTNNRPGIPDGDKILGCFLNTVPVRVKIPASITWKEYAVWLEQKMLEIKKHERLSLFEIALTIGEKSRDRNPFFDTLFNFTDFSMHQQAGISENGDQLKPGDEYSQPVEGQLDTNTLFDFEVDITSGNLFLHPKYNAAAISDWMAAKCCVYFLNILEKYHTDPDSPPRRDDILPFAEKQQLLYDFNDTAVPYDREKTIHRLFEEQVLKTPDNTAVIADNGVNCLTYRQVNETSNRLAHKLQKLGVKVNSIVGVVMERNMAMVPAVMGVLKAGGAYVPLEPYLPDLRIKKLLSALAVECVISDAAARSRLEMMIEPPGNLRHIIDLDNEELKKYPPGNPAAAPGPGGIAYVIYTSGSTGTPKGVVETHAPVVNVIQWVNRTFAIGRPDKLLFVASLAFDLSVYDIFGTLASGGALRVGTAAEIKNPERLLDIITRESITFWDSAPAALLQLTPFFETVKAEAKITGLRLVFLSGDWIPVSLPAALRETFTQVRVISLGGATEATVWSNYYPIEEVDPSWPSIPYGKPIQNAKYYILDPGMNLCPIGIAGDLYIGGECLAREYKNDPVLTVERFITNPFYPGETGERLYKTGDTARWFADGNMQFLGRRDRQVKIRGYRIELGEIEAHLSSYPGIREAIVIDRRDGTGNNYLCAYYTITHVNAIIRREDLTAHLAGELPEYMIPTYFSALDHIPVTPNGKLDRDALPDPGPKAQGPVTAYVGPGDEIEKHLLNIWSEILGIAAHTAKGASFGVEDNFFELGGHSLSAVLLNARIHKELKVKLPLAEIFRTPTIKGMAGYIRGAGKDEYSLIEPVEKKEYYGLSHAQERLWILDQVEKDLIAYNMPGRFELENVNRPALEKTVAALIRRHEILRTTFITVAGEAKQKVHAYEDLDFQIHYYDLRNDANKEAILDNLLAGERNTPFNLAAGPLLRTKLLQVEENRFLFLYTLHHIISDQWSMDIMVKEFMGLYEAYVNGEENPLAPLPVQYKDYTHWHLGQLSGENLKKHQSYWHTRFKGELPHLDLPTDFPRPELRTSAGEFIRFRLHPGDAAQLERIGKSSGATLFVTLLAVMNVFLYKYTGQTDIIVGVPSAGRDHKDLIDQIGFYVNMLPIRNKLRGGQNFKEVLQSVDRTVLEALEHQVYPFDRLVHELNAVKDLSRNPLFDVVVAFETGPERPGAGDDLPESGVEASKHDLRLRFIERGADLTVHIRYNPQLFKKERIIRIKDSLITLIKNIINNVGQKIDHLAFIPGLEKQRELAGAFVGEEVIYQPDEEVFLPGFERQVERTPESPALVFENAVLSYREVNENANQLARHLLKEVGPTVDDRVAIIMERSEKMAVSIIAVWKCRAAYIPLDPNYPGDRIGTIIKDSGAKAVIGTTGSIPGQLAKTLDAVTRFFYIDKIETTLKKEDKTNLNLSDIPTYTARPGDLAYVIYTSGSTGKPKGVMIEQRGMMNHLHAKLAELRINRESVIAQNASHCFDISIWQFFAALLKGGKTVIYADRVVLSPELFIKQLGEQGVNILEVVPSYLAMMLDLMAGTKWALQFPVLNYLLVTGESLKPGLVKRWFEKFPGIKMVNAYGPTEASDDITHFHMDRFSNTGEANLGTGQNGDQNRSQNSIPIGRTLRNFRISICDEDLALCPSEIKGEICVSGTGIGRGYLNNCELTAEKFVPLDNGTVLYRTGDIGRFLPDGNIEFFGRKDYQVKIRGFRIELEEIENKLSLIPQIGNAVVIDREDKAGNTYLCAYITLREEMKNASEIKNELSKTLPAYMVPSFIIVLDALPLTPNGKIDRRALPGPAESGPESIDYAAPRDEAEKKLAEIWCEVMGLERIGIHDNFFALGGNSLLGIRIVNKIQAWLQETVHVTILFLAPTIAQLAVKLASYKIEKETRIGKTEIAEIRSLIDPLAPLPAHLSTAVKTPPVMFVLCPSRSGSTLLRVILAGHPKLFAPQEFELLSFNTLPERNEALSGKFGLYLEGVIRAIMELKNIDADEAKGIMEGFEAQGMTVREFYSVLQSWLGN